MTDPTKNKNGLPWETVGVFDSYENASNQVMHLIAAAPTYNYKIKRCGPLGTQFAVKARIDPRLAEAERKLNEKKLASEQKKKSSKKKR